MDKSHKSLSQTARPGIFQDLHSSIYGKKSFLVHSVIDLKSDFQPLLVAFKFIACLLYRLSYHIGLKTVDSWHKSEKILNAG